MPRRIRAHQRRWAEWLVLFLLGVTSQLRPSSAAQQVHSGVGALLLGPTGVPLLAEHPASGRNLAASAAAGRRRLPEQQLFGDGSADYCAAYGLQTGEACPPCAQLASGWDPCARESRGAHASVVVTGTESLH